jgi:single-strand DNA-binding protein
MASLNKVMLIGRLTADPEPARTLPSGGKVVKFRFAVGRRRKNPQTGQWENDPNPMFIDCDAFNRGEFGKTADLVEQYLRKGSQIFLEGRLEFDQWDDKQTGQKRSKHKVTVERIEFLEPRAEGGEDGGAASRAPRAAAAPARPAAKPAAYAEDGFGDPEPEAGGNDSEIPF